MPGDFGERDLRWMVVAVVATIDQAHVATPSLLTQSMNLEISSKAHQAAREQFMGTARGESVRAAEI
jgi:hypothetical protein